MLSVAPSTKSKRVLKIVAFALAGGLALLLVCLIFLPALVSSDAVQSRIQQALSSTLKRQVAWSSLDLTWSDGLRLTGLKLGQGAAPLLKTDIDQIRIVPAFGRAANGRFAIDLAVRIRNVRAELAPGPPPAPPPPPLKDPLTLLAEAIQRMQELDYPLPVDLNVMLELAPLQVVYRAPGRQLRLQDFSLRLAMPSLATRPITAEVNGRVSLDGRALGGVRVDARVSDLVTKAGRIRLASALFAVDGAGPGTSISLTGGLGQPGGFAGRCKLDLAGILALAQPFMPAPLPKLEGQLELLLKAKSDAQRDLAGTLALNGTGLAASGGALKAKRVGPLNLKLQQRIAGDHARQLVAFPDGSLAIAGLLDAAWSASVSRPSLPGRALELRFGPLRLELARAFSLAAPFLPADLPVRDLSGQILLRSLVLHLKGPANRGDLALAGLAVKLPRLRLALKKEELTAVDLELLLEQAQSPLAAGLPTRLNADLLWSIRRAALSGTEPLVLQGARGRVGLALDQLDLKSASPRRVAASAVLTQSLDLERAALGTKLIIENAHEQLRCLVRAGRGGEIEAQLPEFALSIPSLRGSTAGKRFGPLPLRAALSAANLRIPAGKGARPTLEHGGASISAGDFLQLNADAALSAGTPRSVASNGKARLDLGRVMPLVAPFLPSGLKAEGVVSTAWDLVAPLPGKAPAAEKHPLRSARASLSLIDKLELGVKLDNLSLTLPSAKGAIRVTGLRSGPDLQIVSTKNGESARLEGVLLFSGVSGLPGAAGQLPAQHGSLRLNGQLTGWREFHLKQALRIDPQALVQEAELNVSRIDALLDEKQPFSTATLIKRLDANLFATLDGAFSRDLKPLLPGLDLAGNVNSSLRVALSAGRELSLAGSLKTRDFGLGLANGTRVEGLFADLAIDRAYLLAAARGESWTPFSTALVRPEAVKAANPGAAEIVGRIHDDLRGDLRGARTFSIRRLTTRASGLPLTLTALEGDLLFTPEKAGLGFFQAELLGGTLLARALFDLRPEVPVMSGAGSFSNLDLNRLLPHARGKGQIDRDAGITGELSLTAPLTAEQRQLFEQLRLALNLRKIGANTLERALFSLDPYERNEQLVAQRKMLRLGRLKGLRANAVDGAFSMEGEALVKGVALDLPKVERLRISELPLRQELARQRAAIGALRGVLDLVRADTLLVGPKGELSLKRRIHEN